jgi:hypothetical protein
MQIQNQRVTCAECGRVGDVELVVQAPLLVAIASIKAARCPHCGSAELGLGGSYDDAPPLTAPILDRAKWWHERGEIGTSPETIWSAFTGSRPALLDIPYDPDDFRRCKQLLDLIPEWRADLNRVAKVYRWYLPFVEAWPDLERMYAAEAPTGSCPKMYERMQVLVRAAEKMRRAEEAAHA